MRLLTVCLLLSAAALSAENLPDWYIPLRDAIYEQNLKADEIAPLFRETSAKARSALSGAELYVMLSRCEYMMGRAYQYEERKEEAAAHYAEGMSWAEKALEEQPGDEAWQLLAENISQSCAVRPASFAMANGLKVERFAKNALELNPRNTASHIMIASRWVYAPAPFNNYRKGIQMMEDIAARYDQDLHRDDRFNVYSAVGYAYVQQKKYAQARPWLQKSLEVYPTNKFVRGLLAKS
jgi:tetratricopeptide (TPR) repeat protein